MISATYTGAATLRFSASGLPNGLTMTNYGTITGTPAVGSAGSYSVNVTATDGVLSDSRAYQLTIGAQPEPLVITNENLGSTKLGYQYKGQITVNRTSAAGLTYTASNLPYNLAIDRNTGEITGTVGESIPLGTYKVLCTVTDGVVTATKELGLYVGSNLDDLELTSFTGGTGGSATAFSYKINVNDATNVKVSVSVAGTDSETSLYEKSQSGGTISRTFTYEYETSCNLVLHVRYKLGGESRHKTGIVGIAQYNGCHGYVSSYSPAVWLQAYESGNGDAFVRSIKIYRNMDELIAQKNYKNGLLVSMEGTTVNLTPIGDATTPQSAIVTLAMVVFTNHVDGTTTYSSIDMHVGLAG